MTALTFLEWLDKRQTRLAEELKPHRNNNELELYNTYALDVLHVSHFYNQPFTVDMLVNPIELGKYSGKIVNEDGTIKAMLMGEKDIELFHKWQQSESLRLFEGWEENGELSFLYIYNKNHTVIVDFCETSICFRENDNYELNDYYFYCGYNNITLNDFIILCNLAGIELQFNKSNETIKKLFGEDKK